MAIVNLLWGVAFSMTAGLSSSLSTPVMQVSKVVFTVLNHKHTFTIKYKCEMLFVKAIRILC